MNVLIGYDGSDSARDAIHELHRAGLPRDTRATVMSVADVWPRDPAKLVEPSEQASAWGQAPIVRKARAVAEAAVAEAHATAVEGEALLRAEFPQWTIGRATYAGSPSEALIQPAGQSSDGVPDLVVVGSQGRSAL